MTTMALRSQLAEQLEEVAAERRMRPDDLLVSSQFFGVCCGRSATEPPVARSQTGHSPGLLRGYTYWRLPFAFICDRWSRKRIRAEARAFRAMHDRLVKEYLAKYVAIHDGAVVDHDEDFQALHARIRQKYGRQPVLLRRVEPEPERVLTFRSPSVELGRS